MSYAHTSPSSFKLQGQFWQELTPSQATNFVPGGRNDGGRAGLRAKLLFVLAMS